MEKFRKLGIIEPILESIKEHRFSEPTEIQEKAIPVVVSGKDVIAGSATGSGKTLAFGAGIIQSCEKGKGLQSLVLTPTRELAEQVMNSLKKFSKHKALHIIPVYGGVSINPQIDALRTADVVVGTPGRILDHLERRTIRLDKVKVLVLDEADRMFDMGFRDDVTEIISHCPQDRQTLLFSATISQDIEQLTRKHMRNPVKISAESYVDASKLTQVYYNIDDRMKFSLLVHLLQNEQAGLVMVFCNTRRNTDFVAKNLKYSGIEAMAIHGGFSQAKRSSTMDRFNASKVYVLVCTDVAARGLDIKGVSHVYNYDIPKDSKEYIHRVGRTARAGSEGKAVNILAPRDYDNFARVQGDSSLKIVREDVPPQLERARIGWREEGGRSGGPRGDFRGRSEGRGSPRGESRGFRGRSDDRGPRTHGTGFGRARDGQRGGDRRESSGGHDRVRKSDYGRR
jgi:ATP-dependent RNA helicase DeaD